MIENHILEDAFSDAYDECRKNNTYRLNFGNYDTPKNLWVA